MPGGGQRIVSPEVLKEGPPDVVVLMNPIYKREVSERLAALGIDAEIVDC